MSESRALLDYDTVWWYPRISKFRRTFLSPSSGGSDGSSTVLWNVGMLS